ncbi:MAG: PAS domain-containing protein, partial [Patescibacteria group bacterium]
MILKHFLDYSFNPYSLIFFVAAIVGVYVAFRVIQQRNKSCVVNLFILLLILSILSNIALFFQSNSLSAKNFEFWGFINLTVSVFAAPIFLFFALMFIGKIAFVRNIVFFLLALLPPLIFLFLYWQTDLFISHNFNYAQLAPWGYVPLEGPLEMVGSLFFAIYFCLGYSLIIFHFFKEKNKKNRQPLKIMVIALFVPTLFIPLFQVILPHFLGFPSFPASSVFVMIMSIIIGYALSKYKLSIFNLVDIAPELIESIPTSFLVLDEDKNIRFVSSPAEKFLGYGAGEIIGKNFYNFIKKESRAIYEKETLKILEHEKEVEIEN